VTESTLSPTSKTPASATGSPQPVTEVNTTDRLSFTLFLAAAIHGLIIFGITFSNSQPSESAPSVTVTLATHKAKEAPEDADYLAQFNQDASGTETEAKELTSDKQANFADTEIQDVTPTPRTQSATPNEQQTQAVTTLSQQRDKVKQQENLQTDAQKNNSKDTETIPVANQEIASLRAKLDKQRQEYAKRPRKRALTSVSAKAAVDAAYLQRWTRQVEEVGNRNFPQEAITQRITGSLRLLSVINANGTIEKVEILHSSGQKVLDAAALQIVHLAAPFLPFPSEIRKDTDQLEIIRTWNFEISGLSTSQ